MIRFFLAFAVLVSPCAFQSLYAVTPSLFLDQTAMLNQKAVQSAFSDSILSEAEVSAVQRVLEAIDAASLPRMDQEAPYLSIPGMSSPKNRHFLNTLCAYPETRYLEIGCWKGSTFVSALYHNGAFVTSAIGIDNWSEFGGPAKEFCNNCAAYLADVPYVFYSADCFSLVPEKLTEEKINVYFYDGGHKEKEQKMAFVHFDAILDDLFIAIVDDWNWEPVRKGTFSAFAELNYHVLAEYSLPASCNGDRDLWWNGLYVAVIRKGDAVQ